MNMTSLRGMCAEVGNFSTYGKLQELRNFVTSPWNLFLPIPKEAMCSMRIFHRIYHYIDKHIMTCILSVMIAIGLVLKKVCAELTNGSVESTTIG